MSSMGIENISLLQQMEKLNKIADEKPVAMNQSTDKSFATYFNGLVSSVDNDQKSALNLEKKYVMQDPSVSLSQVMIQMQKSSVSLNALVQVRNKVVNSYKQLIDINM